MGFAILVLNFFSGFALKLRHNFFTMEAWSHGELVVVNRGSTEDILPES